MKENIAKSIKKTMLEVSFKVRGVIWVQIYPASIFWVLCILM